MKIPRHDLILRRHAKAGTRGYLYDVFADRDLLCTSRDPHYSACRALVARGLTGEARFWRQGKATHDFYIPDIVVGAKFFTRESAKDGPRLTRYMPLALERRTRGRQTVKGGKSATGGLKTAEGASLKGPCEASSRPKPAENPDATP